MPKQILAMIIWSNLQYSYPNPPPSPLPGQHTNSSWISPTAGRFWSPSIDLSGERCVEENYGLENTTT